MFDAPELDLAGVRDLADRAKSLAPRLALALLGREEERVPYVIVCQGLPKELGLGAGDLAKKISRHLGGGGGGRPELAQGQGKVVAGVPAALGELESAIRAALATPR